MAATLVEASECYTHQRYATPGSDDYLYNDKYLKQINSVAKAWQTGLPAKVEKQWSKLNRMIELDIFDDDIQADGWQDCAMWLLSVADEASAGIGFYSGENLAGYFVKQYLLDTRLRAHQPGAVDAGPASTALFDDVPLKLTDLWLPHSICKTVPPDRVCVQPKTNVPEAGCTLRSLSHHLALLPSMGVVRTRWSFSEPKSDHHDLNILLVPFPYRVEAKSFSPTEWQLPKDGADAPEHAYFDLQQEWLTHEDCAKELGEFILDLIKAATAQTGRVDGLVLPECALGRELADDIAQLVLNETELEWFISGVFDKFYRRDTIASNWTQFYSFYKPQEEQQKRKLFYNRRQRKHHRWFLDQRQIQRYSLSRVLKTEHKKVWWERIALKPRECNFYLIQGRASIAAIICEDLARQDPVMPVLRAVGPNLLIALLLDGPQLKDRWPSRFATVLADDPGCSVVTLTSLGMVRRSAAPRYGERREIALWKDRTGEIEELKLPSGDHGLVLTLEVEGTTQLTLDGRSDKGMTPILKLADVRGVRVRDKGIPPWLGLD